MRCREWFSRSCSTCPCPQDLSLQAPSPRLSRHLGPVRPICYPDTFASLLSLGLLSEVLHTMFLPVSCNQGDFANCLSPLLPIQITSQHGNTSFIHSFIHSAIVTAYMLPTRLWVLRIHERTGRARSLTPGPTFQGMRQTKKRKQMCKCKSWHLDCGEG